MPRVATRARRDCRVTALLDPDVAQALTARAASEDRSLSSMVERLLRHALTPDTSEGAPSGALTAEAQRVVARGHGSAA